MVIVPAVGRSNPASRRISVLLPHPEGPIITVNLPRSSANEHSRTTVLANFAVPYDLLTLSTTISAAVALAAPCTRSTPGRAISGTEGTVISLLPQPRRDQLSDFAQQRAGREAGDADADHADDNLR